MSLADIQDTIEALGTLGGKTERIRELAEAVKQQQERLKLSVDGAVKLMDQFRGGQQAMRAILERAQELRGVKTNILTTLLLC